VGQRNVIESSDATAEPRQYIATKKNRTGTVNMT